MKSLRTNHHYKLTVTYHDKPDQTYDMYVKDSYHNQMRNRLYDIIFTRTNTNKSITDNTTHKYIERNINIGKWIITDINLLPEELFTL